MSRAGQDFIGLVPPKDKRPKSAFFGPAGGWSLFRDQFTIQTWLAIGAVIQGLLYLLAGSYAFLPASIYLLINAFDTLAMLQGWKRNIFMDNVIMKKFSSQIPNELGEYGNKPANEDVVVLLIGTRSNHPLGVLAPGFKQLGDYFEGMARDLDTHNEEFGYLGMTRWINTSDRTTKSELMMVAYFRTTEGLHAFAHSKYHREGWDWWNKNIKGMPHLSIYHEVYHTPKGHWETIYVNSHASGMNSTSFKVTDKETGGVKWASPVVDASKGLLKTSAGRMNRSQADEHEKYGEDPY